jgi:deoxyguanosine kinase
VLSKIHYLVVEGPIGVGKSSLVKLLAQRMDGQVLMEDPLANPFLASFYQDPQRHALATQLFFLFQRIGQVAGLRQRDLFSRPTVSDFLFDKDPLFAEMNLSDEEHSLYRLVYERLAPQAPAPDLVVYLQASLPVLSARVRRRSATFERGMTEDYLRQVNEAYGRFFHQYQAAPVLMVNSDHLNFVDRPADLDLLIERIESMRGDREFFSARR